MMSVALFTETLPEFLHSGYSFFNFWSGAGILCP